MNVRRKLSTVVIVLFVCFASASNSQVQQPGEVKLSPIIKKSAPFNHNRKEHMRSCSSCHVRLDNKARQNFPYHSACIDCHVSDFTSAESQLCADCHEMPLKATAQTVAFPGNLDEFGVHNFLHRDHMNREKTKKDVKCTDCHAFDAAKIRAAFPGHPQCFSCHTHKVGEKLGTCETCHTYRSTAMVYKKGLGEPYYQYRFTHASHLIQKSIGNNCAKCHPLFQVAVARQSDIGEMKTPREFNGHTSDCWQCHKKQAEIRCGKCHVQGPPLT